MKKKTILIYILILTIFLLVYWGFDCKEIIEKAAVEIKTLEIENAEYEKKLENCARYPVFTEAVDKISEKTYSKSYNCLNFAKDLQKELSKSNIESTILINKLRNHAWLAVWIEPQTGNFIGLNNKYNIAEMRNRNFDVICSCH